MPCSPIANRHAEPGTPNPGEAQRRLISPAHPTDSVDAQHNRLQNQIQKPEGSPHPDRALPPTQPPKRAQRRTPVLCRHHPSQVQLSRHEKVVR